ncbi:MAG: hypothetical protein ACSHYA_01350 [Opitutaceae bacterium]
MKLLDSLEKRFGHLAIPNVVLFLIVAQLVMLAAVLTNRIDLISLVLIPKVVMGGEWWRLFSFTIAPPTVPQSMFQGLFLAFYWYIFWMMSTTLEEAWGVFRFNLFLLSGFLLSIIGAFIGQFVSPDALVFLSPYFLYLSVFFAYATLNPNIQFMIMLVIPVKVKWIAWFVAGVTALSVFGAGSMGERVAIMAPIFNYFLFFRDALTQSVKSRQRRAKFDKERRAVADDALHTCETCGASDRSNPEREFRYKMVDGDAVCVCSECRS